MHKLKILVADDMEHVRLQVEDKLERNTRRIFRPDITLAPTAEEAVSLVGAAAANADPFDLVLIDIDFSVAAGTNLLNGHEASKTIKRLSPLTTVVIVSALGGDEHLNLVSGNSSVTRFFRRSFFTDDEIFWVCLEALVSRLHRNQELLPSERIIYTTSPRMAKFLEDLDRIRPTSNVIIFGETGTGKELAARRLHANACLATSQPQRPFISINCALFDGALSEARLFGYKRGAFSGAFSDTPGIFDNAQDGDIFFDELQSAPIQLQQILMRALQEKCYSPLMSQKVMPLKARFIAAINKPLVECRSDGSLKNDLVARFQQDYVQIPALRERPDDIPLILNILLKRHGSADKSFSGDAIAFLKSLHWPENVRGLEKVAVAAISHSKLPVINADQLRRIQSVDEIANGEDSSSGCEAPASLDVAVQRLLSDGQPLDQTLERIRDLYIRTSWEKNRSIAGVARETGIPFNSAKRRLLQLGVDLR